MTDDLTTRMYAETDTAPPPRVDLARVVRDGRRRRRIRVLLPSAGVAVLVLVVVIVVGISAAALRPRAGVVPPVAPPPSSVPLPLLNPMALVIETGWNPDNLTERTPMTSTIEQVITYSDAPYGGDIHNLFDIALYAPGHVPWQLRDAMPPSITAPSIVDVAPVRGLPAKRFAFAPGVGSSSGLAWQWEPGAWAVARARIGYASNQEQVERLLAENLRTDVPRPVRLPFLVRSPVPGGLSPRATSGEGHGVDPYGVWAQILLGPDGAAGPEYSVTTAPPPSNLVTVAVSPATSEVRKPTPNTTLEGHSAYVSWPVGGVTVFGLDGFDVSVTMPAGANLLTQDQAVALALSVHRA